MDTSITIDREIQHNDKLHSANRAMDDLLGSASSIIGSLTKQGGILKVMNYCVLYYICMYTELICAGLPVIYIVCALGSIYNVQLLLFTIHCKRNSLYCI